MSQIQQSTHIPVVGGSIQSRTVGRVNPSLYWPRPKPSHLHTHTHTDAETFTICSLTHTPTHPLMTHGHTLTPAPLGDGEQMPGVFCLCVCFVFGSQTILFYKTGCSVKPDTSLELLTQDCNWRSKRNTYSQRTFTMLTMLCKRAWKGPSTESQGINGN